MTTTTFRPKFSASGDSYVRCYGTNHRDEGKRGTCVTCLRDIVRVVKADGTKRLYDINSRYNAADRHVEDFACWQHVHECDQAFASRVFLERQAKIEAGELIVIGQHVTVNRGRKVAKGTAGTITWIGEARDYNDQLYTKLGIKTDAGDYVFVKADYCIVTMTIPVHDAGDYRDPSTGKAMKLDSAPRATGSHANCDHPATKAARAACRKARTA